MTFVPQASGLTERIVSHEFDEITFYFNKFESAAKFHNTCIHIPQVSGLGVGNVPSKFKGWEIEPANNEETLVNLMEYGLVRFFARLFYNACGVLHMRRRQLLHNGTHTAVCWLRRMSVPNPESVDLPLTRLSAIVNICRPVCSSTP